MTGGTASSRWADNDDDIAEAEQRKREKAERKRAKAAKQQELADIERRRQEQKLQGEEPQPAQAKDNFKDSSAIEEGESTGSLGPPVKKRRLSPEKEDEPVKLLRYNAPSWGPARRVDNFEKLNHIEEGSYGWVSRAKEIATGEVVALKKLKMDIAQEGFPVTALREIQTLTRTRHRHIVDLREVVVGDTMNESVRAV